MSDDNMVVTKSNHLVEAGYKLSLNEQRLILLAISQIDARKPIPKSNDFVITANEFAKNFNIPIKQAYESLEDSASRLYERDIKTFDKKLAMRERFRWVDGIKYWDGEAKVTLSFSNKVIPYLTKQHRQFTSYQLKQISQLNTAYAIRIYEILIQFINTKEKELYISLEKLRARLEIEDQYKRFYDLKKYIIDPSILDINEKTNLCIEWDVLKKGRVITGILFVFQKNTD